jgi:cell division protein FtsW
VYRRIASFFRQAHAPDATLTALLALLVTGGLVILASASSNIGEAKFGDSYYYVKHQIYFGLTLGIAGFIAFSRLHYATLKKIAFPLLIFSIGLLVAVFTPLGLSGGGATRWISLGPLSFQPAEVLKITYIMYLAAWLSGARRRRTQDIKTGLVPFLSVSGVIALLLFMQPATSTVVILLGSGVVVYFFGGAPWKYIAMCFGLGALAVALLILVTPYRMARITGYLDREGDAQGKGYHVTQSLIAIGSGGITGVGYGKSTTKVSFLPTPADDSIFAVAAEEFGFIGSSLLVALFGALVVRLYMLAWRTKDQFGQLMLIGFGTIIAMQSLVNMWAISGLAPLTGVPLPFISYGGTALGIFMSMIGIASNVSANN